MAVKEVFPGVYKIGGLLATRNITPGRRAYTEGLETEDGIEYRMWNPYRSKLAAAILNGLKHFAFDERSSVLYIGAATGTTASHISDIAKNGSLYCIELSERNMRELVRVCEMRGNMLPILADARYPDRYADTVEQCDIIYQDASAREQAQMLKANARFLKRSGIAYFVIKSQSVDVSKDPKIVFKRELELLSDEFDLLQTVALEPFDRLHMFAVLKKR